MVLGIVLVDHYLGGWIRTTGNHLFPSTVLGHYPLSKRLAALVRHLFGIGLDAYTEEVVFRRCARHVFNRVFPLDQLRQLPRRKDVEPEAARTPPLASHDLEASGLAWAGTSWASCD